MAVKNDSKAIMALDLFSLPFLILINQLQHKDGWRQSKSARWRVVFNAHYAVRTRPVVMRKDQVVKARRMTVKEQKNNYISFLKQGVVR